MYRKRTFMGYLLASVVVFSFAFVLPAQEAKAAADIKRLSGMDRYLTAIEISKEGWQSSDNVVLATGEDFPDALCAAPLAKKLNAPILLTDKGRLSGSTADELKRLKVKKIYIVGGPGVVSDAVVSDITKLTYTGAQGSIAVERIYGIDRAATSVEVAKKLGEFSEMVAATGDNYPDALSIAPIAAKRNIPILLVSKDSISSSVRDFIKDKNITRTYVIGGTGVVSDNVMKDFKSPQRIWGSDRYETNLNIVNHFSSDLDRTNIYVATGEDFPDALAGAAVVSQKSSFMVLTPKEPADRTREFVYSFCQPNSVTGRLYVLGGEGVVPRDTVTKLSTRKVITGKNVTIGTTWQEVLGILGEPKSERNYYPDIDLVYSDVTILMKEINGQIQVVGWHNNKNPKVGMGEKDPVAYAITLGSSKEDVVRALGTPYAIDYSSTFSTKWYYPMDAQIWFDGQYKVQGWYRKNNLNITIGQKVADAPPFTIGSSFEEVVKAMGTPDDLSANEVDISYDNIKWRYGESYVYFTASKKVRGYESKGNLKVFMGSKDPASTGFALGSTSEEVLKAMGTPGSMISNSGFNYTWKYEDSTVTISNEGKVTGWTDRGNLNIKGSGYDPLAQPITIGSTKDDVLKAMGQPDTTDTYYWRYGASDIHFTPDGKVKTIDNRGYNIKIGYSVKVASAPPVTLGSGKEDVLKALGAPAYVKEYEDYYGKRELVWNYGGLSEVMFDSSGKVHRWVQRGSLKIDLGQLIPSAPAITAGSTREDVIKAMGTPDSIFHNVEWTTNSCWNYGSSRIFIDTQCKVVKWENNGNLKVK